MVSKFLFVLSLTTVLLAGWAASAAEPIPLPLGLYNEPGDPGYATGETDGGGGFVDFVVELESGKDYFFAGAHDGIGHEMQLRGPGGQILKRRSVYEDGWFGFEYRAASTATHFLRFVQGGDDEPDGSGDGVGAFAGPDCRNATTTLCTLQVGKSRRGRWDFATAGDPGWEDDVESEWDLYKVRLVAGRTYTATLGTTWGTNLRVVFLDSARRELAAGSAVQTSGERRTVRATFRPRRTGDYWVRAEGGFFDLYYDLLVR